MYELHSLRVGWRNLPTLRVGWFPVVLLLCCVSFWFWREIGFGCTYYYRPYKPGFKNQLMFPDVTV
jgi:hypothetical protein